MSRVLGINVAPVHKETMESVEKVEAIEKCGLDGDRYCQDPGQNQDSNPGALTLIESEALHALYQEHGIRLEHHETRRNILTQGVRLNDLVDQEFLLGQVLVRGTEWCEPCRYLEGRTRPGVLKGLANRGGLRAEILKGGIISKGDPITLPHQSRLDKLM